jgi:Uma2 family endonuclease
MASPDEGGRMTAQPLQPNHLLTIADYLELGEDEHGRTELQEGNLVMSPSPTPNHNVAAMRLAMALTPQLPSHLELILDIDVDLGLVPNDQPGTCRRPDVIVVDRAARQRVNEHGGVIRASDVVVVIEVVSAGSRRMDNIIKLAEYADARIPHYWIVDLDEPVSLRACHLAAEFGYQQGGAIARRFVASEPFEVSLDLEGLF